jgi:hypothetical protein
MNSYSEQLARERVNALLTDAAAARRAREARRAARRRDPAPRGGTRVGRLGGSSPTRWPACTQC